MSDFSIYILSLLLGGISGLFLKYLTTILTKKRSGEELPDAHTKHLGTWIGVHALVWLLVSFFIGVSFRSLEFILVFSICFSLSMVDITVRKIPNSLVLMLLIVGIAFLFINRETDQIGQHIMGLFLAAITMTLPSIIGKTIGWGDIKLASVIGFYLGIFNFCVSIIIAGALIAIYLLYLLITKKGGLKTKIAYGPFLAAGFIGIMLFKLLSF